MSGSTDARDVALASEIVLGTLRWQAALDAALAPLLTRRLDQLEPEVHAALLMAAYQRLFLSRVPAPAIVNDAVALVREAGRASAAGLANAVLRRLDPDTARRAWPPRPSAPDTARGAALDYLATTLSHPRWLVERWLDRHGFDAAERWALFNNAPAPLTLRPVAWRTTAADLAGRLADVGVATRAARHARDALLVTSGNPWRTPDATNVTFLAQDEASQLVAELVADLAPRLVLDTCAAPGGKAIAIRGALGPGGRVVAADLRPRRVRLLRETLRRAGADDVTVVRADFSNPAPLAPVFDVVFVDAPCSGLGTIRREPEIRWRRGAGDLGRFVEIQERLLTQASTCVRPDGHLVYATCSSEPEENEEVVERFLAASPAFSRVTRDRHPWCGTAREVLVDAAGDLRTLPFAHDLEAFYAAVLVHTSGSGLYF